MSILKVYYKRRNITSYSKIKKVEFVEVLRKVNEKNKVKDIFNGYHSTSRITYL